MESLYEQEGSSLKRLTALEQQLLELDDLDETAEIQIRIGRLCFEELEEIERAIGALTLLGPLRVRGRAIESLTELLVDRRSPMRVARILAAEDGNGRSELGLECLDYLRAEASENEERIQSHVAYAQLLEDDEPAAAFQAYAEAYRLSDGRPKLSWSSSVVRRLRIPSSST